MKNAWSNLVVGSKDLLLNIVHPQLKNALHFGCFQTVRRCSLELLKNTETGGSGTVIKRSRSRNQHVLWPLSSGGTAVFQVVGEWNDVLKTKVASVCAPKLICIHSIVERNGYLKTAEKLLRWLWSCLQVKGFFLPWSWTFCKLNFIIYGICSTDSHKSVVH